MENKDKKELLQIQSEVFKRNIEKEVDKIASHAEEMGKKVLVIGGALLLGYYLVKAFTAAPENEKGKGKKKKSAGDQEYQTESTSSVVKSIVTNLADQASLFLLTLAREKLLDYIDRVIEERQQDVYTEDTERSE